MKHKTMTYILIVACVFTLFTNCKRNHYYCNCRDYNGTVYYMDYGTHFTTRESGFKKDCDSHLNASPSTWCTLIAE